MLLRPRRVKRFFRHFLCSSSQEECCSELCVTSFPLRAYDKFTEFIIDYSELRSVPLRKRTRNGIAHFCFCISATINRSAYHQECRLLPIHCLSIHACLVCTPIQPSNKPSRRITLIAAFCTRDARIQFLMILLKWY